MGKDEELAASGGRLAWR